MTDLPPDITPKPTPDANPIQNQGNDSGNKTDSAKVDNLAKKFKAIVISMLLLIFTNNWAIHKL